MFSDPSAFFLGLANCRDVSPPFSLLSSLGLVEGDAFIPGTFSFPYPPVYLCGGKSSSLFFLRRFYLGGHSGLWSLPSWPFCFCLGRVITLAFFYEPRRLVIMVNSRLFPNLSSALLAPPPPLFVMTLFKELHLNQKSFTSRHPFQLNFPHTHLSFRASPNQALSFCVVALCSPLRLRECVRRMPSFHFLPCACI